MKRIEAEEREKMRHVTIKKLIRHLQKGRIDDRIYGSFVEHMGRVVVHRHYEPSHKTADENGFRGRCAAEGKADGGHGGALSRGAILSPTMTGGTGSDLWRNARGSGIFAWKSIETNEVGLDEFMKWADAAEVAPIYAVNLGTKGNRGSACGAGIL